MTEEVIDGPILVSAYDVHYQLVKPPFDFTSLIFLDSGGYEASKDVDLSDFGAFENAPKAWSRDMYDAVLATWQSSVPTIIIGYDHPKERMPIDEQIERAKEIPLKEDSILREILLKPETETQRFLKVDSVIPNIRNLHEFDVIGVTEKEIGNSILERMQNIAKLRMNLEAIGLDTPIHVFGSLDTITTPLYFLAGADIFDGLTWLRFAFHDGFTIYKHNFSAIELGISEKSHVVDGRCWYHNYRYLTDLQLEMRRFLMEGNFDCFSHHSEAFRRAHESMIEAVGV